LCQWLVALLLLSMQVQQPTEAQVGTRHHLTRSKFALTHLTRSKFALTQLHDVVSVPFAVHNLK